MSDEIPRAGAASRRQFCTSACHAASAVAIGAWLPACGGGSSPTAPGGGPPAPQLPQLNGTVTGQGVSVPVDGTSPLAAVGAAALVRSGAGDILVARTAQETFSALTAICTHEACTITGFQNATFVCPCHGSRYTTGGAVLNGPATRSLGTFPTQFTAGTLTIAV